jgi:hypothetical protein
MIENPSRSRCTALFLLLGLLSGFLDLNAYFLRDLFYVLQAFPRTGSGGFVALLEFVVFTFEYF